MSYDPSIIRAAIADPANSGKSSADIAAMFAPVPAYQPIDLAALDSYLQTADLKQPLIRLAANPSTPQQLADGLTDFLDRVDNPKHTTIDYSDADVRNKTNTLVAALIQMGQLTSDQATAIAAMGTVLSYPAGGPVVAADVDREKNGIAADGLRSWFNGHAGQINAAISTAETTGVIPTRADLQAMLDPAV